jgi:hypothetical protein
VHAETRLAQNCQRTANQHRFIVRVSKKSQQVHFVFSVKKSMVVLKKMIV